MPFPPKKYAALLTILIAATIQSPTRAADIQNKINWPEFLARQDPTWQKLPAKWEEGAFMGNGLLGANIWTSDDHHYLKFVIGRSDVVDHNSRIPIGDLLLKTEGTLTGGNLRINLWNAEVTGEIQTTKGTIKIRAFTHANQMVQIIQLTPDAGEKNCSWQWLPGIAADPRAVYKKEQIPEKDKNPDPQLGEDSGYSYAVQPLKSGGGDSTVWHQTDGPDNSRITYLSVGYTTDESADAAKAEALAAVKKAEDTGFDALLSSHENWWHHYWPESFLSIPDARMESFYWIQMYKLASATRANREVIDLMGPWFRTTPWPRIWWNLNIQLTYLPIYTANRLELGEPFCKILDDHKDQLAKNTRPHVNDAYAIGRSSGYDLARTTLPEISDLTWALQNYWLQYKYSMDDQMLRDRLFPLLRGSVNFTLALLKKGDDGKLHITRGFSPEYPGQPNPDPDTNYDLSLLRWGCETLIDSANRLHIDDPLLPKWKEVLADLRPYPVDDNGLMISPTVPFKVPHRHYSHMLMVYPLHILTPEGPEGPQNRALIQKTLDHWSGMLSGFRGFSFTGASAINSVLGNGDAAAKWINDWFDTSLKYKVTPNTMVTVYHPSRFLT